MPLLAPRAPKRDLVRRVADEQHAAVVEAVHAPALEGVDADPFQLELALVAQHGLDARDDVLGLFSSSGSASQPSWKSMRQTLSAWRCSSTDWLGGRAGRTRTSARHGAFAPRRRSEAVHEDLALALQPQHERIG
jgi:hypothetical protein